MHKEKLFHFKKREKKIKRKKLYISKNDVPDTGKED